MRILKEATHFLLLAALTIPASAKQIQAETYRFAFDQDGLGGLPDFSFLNHPLTAADRVFVKNGHFYTVGPDLAPGTPDDRPVRFFGVSMALGANFPNPNIVNGQTVSDATRIAKRLRRLGINLVRLQSLDIGSAFLDWGGVCNDVFVPPTTSSTYSLPYTCTSALTNYSYPSLDTPNSIARLRGFITALENQGIYIDLDLICDYQFRPSVDVNIAPFTAAGGDMSPGSIVLHLYDTQMVADEQLYASELIGQLHLKGDPGLATIELKNEESMIFDWRLGFIDYLLKPGAGPYGPELQLKWNQWLEAKYATAAKLQNAWGSISVAGLCGSAWNCALLTSAVEQKTPYPQQIISDWIAFLVSVDQAFYNAMLSTVRASTDSYVPVTGTQMTFGGWALFDAQSSLSYTDTHYYLDVAVLNGNWNWWIHDSAMSDSFNSNYPFNEILGPYQMLLDLSWARQAGKPYTISEYNEAWPNQQGHEIDPTLAAFGSYQDWDTLIHFDYSSFRGWDYPNLAGWDLNGDWQQLAVIGQSAFIFRTAAVSPSPSPLTVPVCFVRRQADANSFYTPNTSAPGTNLAPPCGIPAFTALTKAVALQPLAAGENSSNCPVEMPLGSSPYTNDTGQLTFDTTNKILLIKGTTAAGVLGYVGAGKTATAGPIDVTLPSTAMQPLRRDFEVVLVTSLDGHPIGQSGQLFVSAPGFALRAVPGIPICGLPAEVAPTSPQPQELVSYAGIAGAFTVDPTNAAPSACGAAAPPSGDAQLGLPPTYLERNEFWLTLRTSQAAIRVAALAGNGSELGTLQPSDIQPVSGGFRIHLNGDAQKLRLGLSPWYAVTAASATHTIAGDVPSRYRSSSEKVRVKANNRREK